MEGAEANRRDKKPISSVDSLSLSLFGIYFSSLVLRRPLLPPGKKVLLLGILRLLLQWSLERKARPTEKRK